MAKVSSARVNAVTKTTGDSTTALATTQFVANTIAPLATSASVTSAVSPLTTAVDGLRDVAPTAIGDNYQLTLNDRGKSIDFFGGSGKTITIPANSTLSFPNGTTITITNCTANNLSISCGDTMVQAGTVQTGTRVLPNYGIATIRKITSTSWLIAGTGLS